MYAESDQSIDLYEVQNRSDLSWYTRLVSNHAANSNHYDWSPARSTVVDLNNKTFVYKFAQDGESDVYSNQFEYSRCRSGWPNGRRRDSNSAAIAGGILGGLAAIGLLTIAGMIVVRRRQAHESSKAENDLELRPLTQRSNTSMPSIPSRVYHPRSTATSFNSSISPPPYSAIYEDFSSDAHSRVSQPPKVRRKPVPSVD